MRIGIVVYENLGGSFVNSSLVSYESKLPGKSYFFFFVKVLNYTLRLRPYTFILNAGVS